MLEQQTDCQNCLRVILTLELPRINFELTFSQHGRHLWNLVNFYDDFDDTDADTS